MALGIDFGTSNSTVGVADAAGARLIAVEGGAMTLPTAVFWDADPQVKPLFGRAAIDAYLAGDDGRLMRGLKSTLGSGLINERTSVGGRAVSFKQVIAAFIGHLRAAAGQGQTQVVMGRPVHFVDDDPAADMAAEAALRDIAAGLGFRDIEFQYEPIAAALHYESSLQAEELVLIFDIGGGTSDLSLVRLSPARARLADRGGDILGNDGIRVGGTDFDRALSLSQVMPDLGMGGATRPGALGSEAGVMPRHYYLDLATWHRINALYSPRTAADLKALRALAERPELIDRLMRVIDGRHGHALAMQVEQAKIALSGADAARLDLAALTGGGNPVLRRQVFEDTVQVLVARIGGLIARVMGDAGVTPAQVGTVFMTGGSSGLPILRALVAAALPDVRIATGDMLGSVGTGLALDAARRFA